jgi:hypothetical protein
MMSRFAVAFLAFSFSVCASSMSRAQSNEPVASIVEKTIKEREPKARFITTRESTGYHPDEEEKGVKLIMNYEGRQVAISVNRMKTAEAAGNIFLTGTQTAWPRKSYKLSADGQKLKRITDRAVFHMNEHGVMFKTSGFNQETYDAAFTKGKVAVFVEARKPEVAQRFAVYIAEALLAAGIAELQ